MLDDQQYAGDGWRSLVQRPRLTAQLEAPPVPPIVVVTAGAGFGKSTVVREWLAASDSVWVELTPADREAATFLEKVARNWEGSGEEAAAGAGPGELLEAALRGADATDPETQARLVAGALEGRGLPTGRRRWLILDDLHELGDGPSIALIGGLVRQLPAGIGVAITSRAALPFPTQRLRGRGLVRELTGRDLAFDEAEVGTYLELAIGRPWASAAAEVMALTEGWPAVVRLIAETLRGLPPERRREALSGDARHAGNLFAYLAEEVFGTEPDNVVEVIRALAPFDAVDAELCAELGLSGGAAVLEDLERRGLFVRRADGAGGYVLHGLLRAYARDRLPQSTALLAAQRRIGAAWHARHGRHDEALRLAMVADDAALASSLLREFGGELVARGRADLVVAAIDALPSDAITADIVLQLGDAHAFRGRSTAALAAYERAIDLVGTDERLDERLRGGDASIPAAVAWRIGRVLLEMGDPSGALAALVAAAPTAQGTDKALVLGHRALVAFSMSDPNGLATALDAVDVADEEGDALARAVAHAAASYFLTDADPVEARRHYLVARSAAEASGDIVQLVRLRNADDAIPSVATQFDEATKTLAMIEAAGNPLWHSRTLINRALIALDQGRLELAAADLEHARQLTEGLDPSASVLPIAFLAELARIRGDLGQAEAGFSDVVDRADAAGDRRIAAYARAGLARLVALTDPARARTLIDRALAESVPHDASDALVGAAWIAACQERPTDARTFARAAIETSALSPGRMATLASAIEADAIVEGNAERRIARLEEAAAIWERIGNGVSAAQTALVLATIRFGPSSPEAAAAWDAVRASGVRSSAGEAAGLLAMIPTVAATRPSVRVLGGFSVIRSGRPIPISEWKSRKARDVLKILVTRHGAPVTRDELVEWLWPEQESDGSAGQLLSVALSHLRRVLDPAHASAADRFVTMERQAVALRVDELDIDLEAFVRDARVGLAHVEGGRPDDAAAALAAAEARYSGDLLPEDRYADWAVGPREEARGLYVRVASALAELADASGDPGLAVRYLMRAVAVEPYDEGAHLGLVRALEADGRRSDARRAYQAYVGRMAELEVEPAPYPTAG